MASWASPELSFPLVLPARRDSNEFLTVLLSPAPEAAWTFCKVSPENNIYLFIHKQIYICVEEWFWQHTYKQKTKLLNKSNHIKINLNETSPKNKNQKKSS